MLASLFILSAIFAVAFSAYAPDEILSLPGWNGPLPTKQYSGYLNVSSTHLHYWLVTSENDASNDPVVIWFNGGPGCSSMDGFAYEHGPFEISADGSTLTTRPYRWNRLANMLFIESPVGVGFSYSDNDDYKCNDDRTAEESLGAVQAFYSMFPEFAKNKLFITGESYAGVYVPTLAEAILKAEAAGTYTGAPLTGIAVGNGCSGTEVGICGSGTQGTYYEWSYLKQTSFVDVNLKTQIDAECNWAAAANNTPNALSARCVSLLNQASAEISHVNLYDIYGDCVDDMCSATNDAASVKRGKVPLRAEYVVDETDNSLQAVASGQTTKSRRLGRIIPHGPDACIDSGAASAFFNRADVQQAIHVRAPGFCWAVCNTQPGWSYKSTRTNLPKDTYPYLVSNIQVVIYNGDWDACVPYTDGFGWTESMGFPVKTAWHNWRYTSAANQANQVAGYAIEYDVSALHAQDTPQRRQLHQHSAGNNGHSFSFVTVRGGRHEVPESAPAQALEMLKRVLGGESF